MRIIICVHTIYSAFIQLQSFGKGHTQKKYSRKWTWRPFNAQSVRVICARSKQKSNSTENTHTQPHKKALKICGEDGRLTVAGRDENERITTKTIEKDNLIAKTSFTIVTTLSKLFFLVCVRVFSLSLCLFFAGVILYICAYFTLPISKLVVISPLLQ